MLSPFSFSTVLFLDYKTSSPEGSLGAFLLSVPVPKSTALHPDSRVQRVRGRMRKHPISCSVSVQMWVFDLLLVAYVLPGLLLHFLNPDVSGSSADLLCRKISPPSGMRLLLQREQLGGRRDAEPVLTPRSRGTQPALVI